MSSIKTTDEAHQEWNAFDKKYAHLVQKKEKNFYRDQPVSEEFKTRLNEHKEAAKAIAMYGQRFFRGRRERDTFVTTSLTGLHPDPDGARRRILKDDDGSKPALIPLQRSNNKWKLKALDDALKNVDWNDNIFKDKTIRQLALGLYESGKITQQQTASILEFSQATKAYSLQKIYRIVNAEGKFTKEAKQYLLPKIQNTKHVKKLTKEQKKAFRLLIKTLLESEQIFYITDAKAKTDFGDTLVDLDAIFLDKNTIIHLTRGAMDALGISRYGVEEYVKQMFQFGMMNVNDIEAGMIEQVRYGAIYDDEIGELGKVHDEDASDVEKTRHDDYHREVASATPKVFINGAFGRLVNIIRQSTGIHWTKEIWDYRDADYKYFFDYDRYISPPPDFTNTSQMTRLFCLMLLHGNGTTKQISYGGSLVRGGELTYIGVLTFIDMIKNPDVWSELKIDPEKLVGIFADHYNQIKEIYPLIEKDNPKIQSLKCFIYNTLKEQGKESDFVKLNDIINTQTEELISRLSFRQITKKMKDINHDLWINTSYLSFDGIPISRATIEMIKNDIANNRKSNLVFPDTEEGALSKGRVIYDSVKIELLMKSKGFTLQEIQQMDTTTVNQYFRNLPFHVFDLMQAGLDYKRASHFASTLQKYQKSLFESFNNGDKSIPLGNIVEVSGSSVFELLKKGGVSIKDIEDIILHFDEKNKTEILFHATQIAALIEYTGTDLKFIESMSSTQKELCFTHFRHLKHLMVAGLSFDSILNLKDDEIKELFDHSKEIATLIEVDITLSAIFAVEEKDRISLYKNSSKIATCVQGDIPFVDIIKLSDDELKSRVEELSQNAEQDQEVVSTFRP